MSANLESSAVVRGLEKISFHSNPKERQCQRMFKLPHNCTYLTCQQDYAQNAVHESRTPRCTAWFREVRGTRDQIANIHWIKEKASEFQKTIYFCSLAMLKSLGVWIKQIGKFFKR